jgi:hypothetical protein
LRLPNRTPLADDARAVSVRLPMPKPSRVLLLTGFTLAAVLLAARPIGTAASSGGATAVLPLAAANLDAEKRAAQPIAEKVTAYLGPLAPVALSPFFALTCLSGASLLADSDLPIVRNLTSGIKGNPLLGANSALNNPVVFLGLLALTVLTAAPKLTKVTKPLAQAVDQIEAHAGIIAIVAVHFLSKVQIDGDAAPTATVVLHAGIFSFTTDVLLAIATAVNIFVVNTVKFFFEVLIWLSPVPAVDAIFEAANKSCVAFLTFLYLWSPWLATLLNLAIFLVCLLIFAWVRRRVIYMRGVLGDPIMGWMAEKIFRRPRATATSTPLPSAIAREFPDRTLVLKAFVGKSVPGMKRKVRGFLIQAKDGKLAFARPRLLRAPVIVSLPEPGAGVTVGKGLLSNTITLSAGTDAPVTLFITRRYNALLDEIRHLLGAPDGASVTPAPAPALAESRALGAAAQAQAGRDTLRAEFA